MKLKADKCPYPYKPSGKQGSLRLRGSVAAKQCLRHSCTPLSCAGARLCQGQHTVATRTYEVLATDVHRPWATLQPQHHRGCDLEAAQRDLWDKAWGFSPTFQAQSTQLTLQPRGNELQQLETPWLTVTPSCHLTDCSSNVRVNSGSVSHQQGFTTLSAHPSYTKARSTHLFLLHLAAMSVWTLSIPPAPAVLLSQTTLQTELTAGCP